MGRRAGNEHGPADRSGLRRPRTWVLMVAGVLLGVLGSVGWLLVRGREAQVAVAQLQDDGGRLQQQLSGYDLVAAGPTLATVRRDAARAHELTDDPIWGIAAAVPVLGRDLRAARTVSAVLADLTTATRPLETILPQLDPTVVAQGGGRVDTAALSQLAQALPAVSTAVSAGAITVGELDPDPLRPEIQAGVNDLAAALDAVRGPLADAVPVLRTVPVMLGAEGQRSWVVLLQQAAEARGTGGLVGAFAEVRTDRGRVQLVGAQSRSVLDRGPAIPTSRMPPELRALYGRDLSEWAGFNASPHFAYTGELVAAGWQARPGAEPLDYVAAVDQYVVAAMLAATGPVDVRDVEVNESNAVTFLSQDVYQRWEDPQEVDEVTTELVEAVFARFTEGRFNLPTLIRAMRAPVAERRLLIWAADPAQQDQISRFGVAGGLPGAVGPFAMAVVNNGGGNKLDAYLDVHTDYQPGACSNDVRVGQISVTLTNTAPRSGLPDYVNVRSDLLQLGLTGRQTRDGSNRILLDIYGPVGSAAAVTTLDGSPLAPVTGLDNNHTVWRVVVPIEAGQSRTVNVVMTTPAVDGDVGTEPVVLIQPMVKPATASTTTLAACENSSATRG